MFWKRKFEKVNLFINNKIKIVPYYMGLKFNDIKVYTHIDKLTVIQCT
jgi:hypothetical protein